MARKAGAKRGATSLGPDGWVEWDANPNPVHERVQAQLPALTEGRIELGASAGLGLDLSIAAWRDFVRWQGEAVGPGP